MRRPHRRLSGAPGEGSALTGWAGGTERPPGELGVSLSLCGWARVGPRASGCDWKEGGGSLGGRSPAQARKPAWSGAKEKQGFWSVSKSQRESIKGFKLERRAGGS